LDQFAPEHAQEGLHQRVAIAVLGATNALDHAVVVQDSLMLAGLSRAAI